MDEKRADDRRRLRPQVILLGFAALFNDISSDMMYPLLPLFLTAYVGATPFIVGMVEGSADAISAFLKLGSGVLSDRVPRRKPLIVSGYGLAAISRVMIVLAAHWPTVLGARLLDRTGKGIRSAPRDAMISDVTPPESRGRAFGFHRALDHSGAVIGPLVAAALLLTTHISLRALFLVAVIPAVMGTSMLFLLLKEEVRVSVASNAGGKAGGALPRPFWQAIAPIALFYLANSSDAFLILQASAAGVRMAFIPLLWAAHHSIKALFSTAAGDLSDRTDRRNLLIAGWLTYSVIYLVFPAARSLGWFLVMFILYAIPFALTEGAERAWIADLVPPEVRGKSFGIYYLVVGIFTLGGTALFGYLFQEVSPTIAFRTGGVIALLAALGVLVQKGNARKSA